MVLLRFYFHDALLSTYTTNSIIFTREIKTINNSKLKQSETLDNLFQKATYAFSILIPLRYITRLHNSVIDILQLFVLPKLLILT